MHVVYRVDPSGGEPELELEQSLPGSATSWTPSLASCLEPGGRYAWSVRAEGAEDASEWSTPRLFAVVAAPVEAQIDAVLDRLGEARETSRGEEGEAAVEAQGPGARSSAARTVAPRASAGTLLNVGGGIAGTTIEATGAITSAGSLSLDGTTDTITAASGTLSFADENLTTTGTTSTAALRISGLDCTGNANGGALTASATGVVGCSDDEVGTIAPDSLDFADLADALTADATTTVDLDTNGADLDLDASTLFLDSSENRVGIGTETPAVTLDVVGDVRATGTITADGGMDLGMGGLNQLPGDPVLAGSLGIGFLPVSVFVSGRYAYVVDQGSDDLKVIDVSGAEFSSAIVHSLEAGSLQVRESLIAQGQLQVTGGATIGSGGLFSDGNVGIDGTLALATDVAPTSSPGNAIQLYADGDPAELKVRDEAGNVTTLSSHNFSLVGTPSEPLAWSYYSENGAGRINVDMLRTVRLVEELSGETLVHARATDGSAIEPRQGPGAGLRAEVEALKRENRELRLELSRIQEALGIQ